MKRAGRQARYQQPIFGLCTAGGCRGRRVCQWTEKVVIDAASDPWLRPATVPFSAGNARNPDKAALGKTVFFDLRLSGSDFISCAAFHNPSQVWSDGQPTPLGHGFKRLGRASPTISHTAYVPLWIWDGRIAINTISKAVGSFQRPVAFRVAFR